MLSFFVVTFLNNECSLLAKSGIVPMIAAEVMVSAMVVCHWFVISLLFRKYDWLSYDLSLFAIIGLSFQNH